MGVADRAYDLRHATSATGDVPTAPREGRTDTERDAVRAYARQGWIDHQRRWPGM